MPTASTSTSDRAPWDWEEIRRACLTETRRVLGAGPEAEDAAQEALVRIWRRRHQCRHRAKRTAWARRTARNEALRRLERRNLRTAPLEQAADLAVTAPLAPDRVDLQRGLARLSEADRVLMLLRYGRDLSHGQLAELLEVPEPTIRVRLHRARARLRQVLAQGAEAGPPRP